jgi:hypothetical protein
MTLPFALPFALPDWLPAWAFLLIALPVLLWLLALLLMPFSVFGVKARLEGLEAQISALQDDIRAAGLRNATAVQRAREMETDEAPSFERLKAAAAPATRAYDPPPPLAPGPRRADLGRVDAGPRPPRRMEPRLD